MTEQRPEYLQDVVVPKETEKAPEGFDLDKEFEASRKEEFQELCRAIPELSQMDLMSALNRAAWHRILFGGDAPSYREAIEVWEESFKHYLNKLLDSRFDSDQHVAAFFAAQYRILTGKIFQNDKDQERMTKVIKESLQELLAKKNDYEAAAKDAATFLALGGRKFWSSEEHEKMKKTTRVLARGADSHAAFRCAAWHRLLKAYDLKFTKDGITIIDVLPQPYQQKPIPPMPEERRF